MRFLLKIMVLVVVASLLYLGVVFWQGDLTVMQDVSKQLADRYPSSDFMVGYGRSDQLEIEAEPGLEALTRGPDSFSRDVAVLALIAYDGDRQLSTISVELSLADAKTVRTDYPAASLAAAATADVQQAHAADAASPRR